MIFHEISYLILIRKFVKMSKNLSSTAVVNVILKRLFKKSGLFSSNFGKTALAEIGKKNRLNSKIGRN